MFGLLSKLRRKRRKYKLTREDSLAAVPLRNPLVSWEKDEETGHVVLRVPRRDDLKMRALAYVLMLPKERRIELDEIGSFVWLSCDGKNTVMDLVRAVAERYKLSQREATLSLSEFLRGLGKRNLIAFALDEERIRRNLREEQQTKKKNRPKRRAKSRVT